MWNLCRLSVYAEQQMDLVVSQQGCKIRRNSPCDFGLIPKIKEPKRSKRFATRENIANVVRQQMTRFTHGAANAEADGIQRLLHRWQRVVTVAGDYIEGL
ncbi:uncharacterized protein TNCV_944942 [Trichonephila clavipes]|nr:uncharacterized protein TNCV_944942 [Trichonephila clavipes]